MDGSYNSLKGKSEAIIKEKGSKFIGYSRAVCSHEEADTFLAEIKSLHAKARHHCFAWRIGHPDVEERANDDGEPSGTAGRPILGQLVKLDLTDAMVVVVRYFGGIKLGVGGLIVAYKTASSEAIQANTIITAVVTETVKFTFDYQDMNDVMRLIKEDDLQIVQQHFDNRCTMTLSVREALMEKARNHLQQIPSLTLED